MTAAEVDLLCGQFIERGVAGGVSFKHQAGCETTNQRITERLKHANIPVVLLDRDIVGVDNVAGVCSPTTSSNWELGDWSTGPVQVTSHVFGTVFYHKEANNLAESQGIQK